METSSDQATDGQTVLALARSRVLAEAAGVATVVESLDESFLTAARLIYGCSGKVFVTGSGTSGTIARRMAHLFSVSGTPSVFLPAMDALHGTLGVVTEGDLLIVISKGGGSVELNDLAVRAKDRGAGIVAVTCRLDTPLTAVADLVLVAGADESLDLGGMIAMGSTLAHAALGDALAVVLMRARDHSWATVHHLHPGGAVGAKTELPEAAPALTLQPLALSDLRAPSR